MTVNGKVLHAKELPDDRMRNGTFSSPLRLPVETVMRDYTWKCINRFEEKEDADINYNLMRFFDANVAYMNESRDLCGKPQAPDEFKRLEWKDTVTEDARQIVRQRTVDGFRYGMMMTHELEQLIRMSSEYLEQGKKKLDTLETFRSCNDCSQGSTCVFGLSMHPKSSSVTNRTNGQTLEGYGWQISQMKSEQLHDRSLWVLLWSTIAGWSRVDVWECPRISVRRSCGKIISWYGYVTQTALRHSVLLSWWLRRISPWKKWMKYSISVLGSNEETTARVEKSWVLSRPSVRRWRWRTCLLKSRNLFARQGIMNSSSILTILWNLLSTRSPRKVRPMLHSLRNWHLKDKLLKLPSAEVIPKTFTKLVLQIDTDATLKTSLWRSQDFVSMLRMTIRILMMEVWYIFNVASTLRKWNESNITDRIVCYLQVLS